MPRASIVVPAYNAEATLDETLRSLVAQSFRDLEIVVVDDGSSDRTPAIARSIGDPRIRLVQQPNRGLAGARNSGIHAAKGEFVGFCDADDLWRPTKLARHVAHLDASPQVGLSYSGSELIDADGRSTGLAQRPRLSGVTAAHVFKRNPVGNGSAPVFRRAALDAIAWRPAQETARDWWFDETFRQSEDIECWLRLALTTDWDIAGVPGLLTRYRVAPGGLSAALDRQYDSWERMVAKLTPLAPDFMARHAPAARAYQLRYLARRAVSAGDADAALARLRAAFAASLRPAFEEPVKTGVTAAATLALAALGTGPVDTLRRAAARRTA
ncbi:glycosyltransferase family 2 protein [Roseivivax sediminis]|uniref:Glycosyl transferase family 2 n=1 Tax=Roseivivax sediminis TaxID=936889 RepID=A0A1I1X0Q5_9RHOB|nr:glycosyltransferase family 2 protein [Roseivivax sediminis]SFE00956.1 Glycosyl transferase family 2 [Roseivivax sediminis]